MGLSRGAPIRFLGEDASRTGTPRLLASLLAWLAENEPAHARQVVLQHGGALQPGLEQVAEVRVVDAARGGRQLETVARGLEELGRPAAAQRLRLDRMRLRQRGLATPGLVWAQGAAALRWIDAVPAGVPLVAHIHELEVGIDRSLAGLDPRAVLARADLVIAVSAAVAEHLVAERGVAPGRVRVHHGWVPSAAVSAGRPPEPVTGVPRDALVVGACGTVGWRKGADLFLAAAQIAPAEVGGRPVHWVWVGGGPAIEQQRFARDIAARGLAGRVHLVGEVDSVEPWYGRFDVFALTSREDPFPLVALEAAAAGLAIATFASGGITELLGPDRARCVAEPLDVEGLAAIVETLLDDDNLRRTIGDALRRRVDEQHRAEVAIPPLWADVSGSTAGRSGGRVHP